MKDTKIQWHPGFVSAMNLELIKYRECLEFEKEYNLNTKPLEIDLLVIKKDAGTDIVNEIGRIFRGHNIMEYKSPGDHLDIDVFYKAGAYAGLYKSYGSIVDERKAEDITVSIVREGKPQGLFEYLRKHGYTLLNPYRGIYYVEGNVLFPTQIIVTKELDEREHVWLRALSGNVEKKDARLLLEKIKGLNKKGERELAEAVLEVMLEANKRLFENWKGDEKMLEALMEIMEPQLRQREESGRKEGRKEGREEGRKEGMRAGICGAVEMLRGLGHSDAEIRTVIMNEFGIKEEETLEYFK
ncbi:hypothetical protein AALA98_01030 [Lachnospiraceae bacterium 45-W7]